MGCEFRVTIEDEMSEDGYDILPIAISDLYDGRINKRIFKSTIGLKNKIRTLISDRTKRGVCRVRSFVILARNKNKGHVKVVPLIIGKSKPSLSKLGDVLMDLNDKGRVSGLWKLRVSLIDTYGELDISKVIGVYVSKMRDYPGIIEFIVNERDLDRVTKILKKKR